MVQKSNNKTDRSKQRVPAPPPSSGAQDVRLPPSIVGSTGENTVQLSGASEFFRKRAESAPLLVDFVEALPNCSYRLKNGFEHFFFVNLPMFPRPRQGGQYA